MVIALGACESRNSAGTLAASDESAPILEQLHQQYSELALRERSEGNPVSARHFERKATMAAAGTAVAPDAPMDAPSRELHLRLSASSAAAESMPAAAARAQVMYDCWLEEYVQAVDPDEIAACMQAFERAMTVIAVVGRTAQ